MSRLHSLAQNVCQCRKCDSMANSPRVAVSGPPSKILFIGEAPGRNGAGRTGVCFSGDPSGANLDRLLLTVNWRRNSITITNAVMCVPLDAFHCNRSPSNVEIRNCSSHLRTVVNLVNPLFVVTLGAKALLAIRHICNHDFVLRTHAAKALLWNHRTLIPLYHPSPRVFAVRGASRMTTDFERMASIVEGTCTH